MKDNKTPTIRVFLSAPAFAFDPVADQEVLTLTAFARAALKEGKDVHVIPFQGHPGLFLTEPAVAEALEAEGDDALPITMLDDVLKLKGRAPTVDELSDWLDMDGVDIDLEREAKIQRTLSEDVATACGGCSSETSACISCASCSQAFLAHPTDDAGDLDFDY